MSVIPIDLGTWPVGTDYLSQVEFQNTTTNVDQDPQAVLLELTDPMGTKLTNTYGTGNFITRTSTAGKIYYAADIMLAIPGDYKVHWYSTGTAMASFYGIIHAERPF